MPDLSGLVDVSQHGEATMVAPLIGDGWPPYLVDVGAHDGRSLSNSHPFLELGWSGTLVEPLPAAFDRLEALYRDRPDVHTVQAACGDGGGTRPLYVGEDAELAMTSTLAASPGARTVMVPVRPLTEVLDSCGAPRDFSLLFVDAEGMDYEVLAGLDFDRYRPRVVVTEDDVANAEKHAAKRALLERSGYAFYTLVGGCNSIWVRDELGVDGDPLSRVSREALVRRCAELERSRDELWRELTILRTSRSWRLTRPLRAIGRRIRSARGG